MIPCVTRPDGEKGVPGSQTRGGAEACCAKFLIPVDRVRMLRAVERFCWNSLRVSDQSMETRITVERTRLDADGCPPSGGVTAFSNRPHVAYLRVHGGRRSTRNVVARWDILNRNDVANRYGRMTDLGGTHEP